MQIKIVFLPVLMLVLSPVEPNAMISNCHSDSSELLMRAEGAEGFQQIALKSADYSGFRKKPMNIFQRVKFAIFQRKLTTNGPLKVVSFEKAEKPKSRARRFHLGGFLLGLCLSWPGVIVASLINDKDKALKARRVKWAWIGVATIFVLTIFSFINAWG